MGLAVFALIALGMLYKSMPKGGAQAVPNTAAVSDDPESGLETGARDRPLTQRDQLQSTVRENPEMTAAVLAKWLKSDA